MALRALPLILDENKRVAVEPETSAEAFAHLLAILKFCEEGLDENGFDIEARVVEAHRAQLARGKEWPGEGVDPNIPERIALRTYSIDP